MQQYLELLQTILDKGTHKPAARENMPSTISLFGYQFRHDLQKGFPLLTTKKMYWKGVVTELLWFLRGDTNIKYLVDNGCNIWNEDAFSYMKKLWKEKYKEDCKWTLEQFVECVKVSSNLRLPELQEFGYQVGDCGKQYGWLWRNWEDAWHTIPDKPSYLHVQKVDQISELIKGLKENPMSRRHIISAWNPATLDQMALHPCHALVQFNCRPLTLEQRIDTAGYNKKEWDEIVMKSLEMEALEHVPEYI